MNSALMFSKASDEWATPQDLFDALNAEFDFDRDAAATLENRKCEGYFGPDHEYEKHRDALSVDWFDKGSIYWLNPPYSKCREFMGKAALEARKGCTVVCLVPARTDTRWFHEHVWSVFDGKARPGVEVRFLKGRLKFGGATAGAPFPSVVIIFRPVR